MTKQYYADYHFHSSSSPDSTEPLKNHILSAKKRNISALCITDHWDLVDDAPTLHPALSKWHQIYQETQNSTPMEDLNVYFGVEMGDGYLNPSHVESILAQHPLDFVLGSVHAIPLDGNVSIYYGMKECHTLPEQRAFFQCYFETLLLQANCTYFDSLSHITYPFRYLPEDSPIQVTDYLEPLTATLEQLKKQDICMEVNTTQGKTLEIWKPILQRYKEIGGTLITLGSDAHRATDTSLGIPEAVALLKELGFQTYCIFEKRKMTQIPIL